MPISRFMCSVVRWKYASLFSLLNQAGNGCVWLRRMGLRCYFRLWPVRLSQHHHTIQINSQHCHTFNPFNAKHEITRLKVLVLTGWLCLSFEVRERNVSYHTSTTEAKYFRIVKLKSHFNMEIY